MGRSGPSVTESSKIDALTLNNKVNATGPAGLRRVMIGIGEQVYSLLLLGFFFLENLVSAFPNVSMSRSLGVHVFQFVLSATGTEAEHVSSSTQRRGWNGAELGKVHVFYAVDSLLMRILSLFSLESGEDSKTL
ncbi:Detected protein of unknown function [Hibiscus syriacus]|uniref:Uncharacterized protein n=1 Tax=Hibiscus syriacus TaxID=106335 RepID=A0A6A2ZAJ9_HIBSY|nr:Detected protein of unknown function [Hibiscus syriacus]